MKKLLTVLLPFLYSVVVDAQILETPNLEALAGTWHRTNSKPGNSGIEVWTKVSDVLWHGIGTTLRGTDTVFVEKLKIVVNSEGIFYVADVPENKLEVYFAFTKLTENEFVCENPSHDFPKKITYQFTGNTLRAEVSGNGKVISYLFERQE